MSEFSEKIKELNSLFERIYRLTEDVLDNHCCDKLELGVAEFFEIIKTECAWDQSEENKPYFEAGYHDSIRVFYPFDGNMLDKVLVETYKKKWLKYLKCVCTYSACCGDAAVLYRDLQSFEV